MLANLILSFICVKKVKEMSEDRSWIYEGRVVNGKISVDWVNMVGQRYQVGGVLRYCFLFIGDYIIAFLTLQYFVQEIDPNSADIQGYYGLLREDAVQRRLHLEQTYKGAYRYLH